MSYEKRKATNGRHWSDHRIEQEKRQKEINKLVYENKTEELDFCPTLILFILICIMIFIFIQ